MEINSLKLKNYRNHTNIQQAFYSGLNVIIGPNGIGKSNIIEAIGLLATTKSFRSSDFHQLIQKDKEFAIVEGGLSNGKLKIVLSQLGRQYWLDQNNIKSSSDFIGLFPALVFSPDDLAFIGGSPKFRRRFLDSELSKVDKPYLKNLSEYQQLLKNRNALLKSDNSDEELIQTLDESMAKLMVVITNRRGTYLNDINDHINQKLQKLDNSNEKAELSYQSLCQNLSLEEVLRQLQNYRKRDLLSKQSNFGSHRDDYLLSFAGQVADGYCSQGQKRLLMIALKLVLADLIEELKKEKPVLLLDDVLSELDLNHQKQLLGLIKNKGQTIITTSYLSDGLEKSAQQLISL